MLSKRILVLLFFWSLPGLLLPCTTAVVSGRATPDGRPLLWKHRDSGFEQNVIRYMQTGKYSFVGLFNAEDSSGNEVWAGVNEVGFAIMNAASYNLKSKSDTTHLKDQEGRLMKWALQTCATLSDFEHLLDTLPKPLGVESNFGVIDARGGAAYYETDNYNYHKLDVNDPAIAPQGFLVHTNFSFTGRQNQGLGYIRFQKATELFNFASATNQLTPSFILQKVSRSLEHGLTKEDLTRSDKKFAIFQDYIPRYSSVSVLLIQGVRPGENPKKSLIWTILGFPLTSVALPIWLAGTPALPGLLKPDFNHQAALCQASLKLKEKCFPINRGSGHQYLYLPLVWNQHHTGILQKILSFEKSIFLKTRTFNATLPFKQPEQTRQAIKAFYENLEKSIRHFYNEAFKIELK